MQELEYNGEGWWPCAVCECSSDRHGDRAGWCSQHREHCYWTPMQSTDERFYGLTGVVTFTTSKPD